MGWMHLSARSTRAHWETDSGSESIRVALLADTHTPADPAEAYRGFKPVENLRTIAGQIVESAPAAAIRETDDDFVRTFITTSGVQGAMVGQGQEGGQ